jgi:mycofactocin precursor
MPEQTQRPEEQDVERVTAPEAPTSATPGTRSDDSESGVLMDQLLVEDVSIDGMCGVY